MKVQAETQPDTLLLSSSTHVHVITNREEEREEGKRDKERREGDVNVKQYQLHS